MPESNSPWRNTVRGISQADGLSQNKLSLAMGVPARRINEIVLQKRSITTHTAPQMARYFQNSPQFGHGLQMDYELDLALEQLGSHRTARTKAS